MIKDIRKDIKHRFCQQLGFKFTGVEQLIDRLNAVVKDIDSNLFVKFDTSFDKQPKMKFVFGTKDKQVGYINIEYKRLNNSMVLIGIVPHWI